VYFLYLVAILVTHQQILFLSVTKGTLITPVLCVFCSLCVLQHCLAAVTVDSSVNEDTSVTVDSSVNEDTSVTVDSSVNKDTSVTVDSSVNEDTCDS